MFDDFLKIRTWSLDGSRTEHITEKLQSKTWSGSYQDCARQLSFSALPEALMELGGMVRLYKGPDILFSGHIVSRSRDSLGKTIDCTSLDNGLYLKRNSDYLSVRNQTPEAITRQLCEKFGIPCGELAAAGVPLTRNFLGDSLYQIIQTMYSLAAEQTGKQYQIRFRSNHLYVVEKAIGPESIRLTPGSNLIWCRAAESIEKMVNRVAVYDDEFQRSSVYDSPEGYIGLYGLMQQAIKASDKENPEASAKDILEQNGISTTITALCLGNTKLIAGNAVVVHEPVTGVDGLFWITSDSHTTVRGVYQTKVSLDFRNLMDKQSAGSVPAE